jgi:hypothetical protein
MKELLLLLILISQIFNCASAQQFEAKWHIYNFNYLLKTSSRTDTSYFIKKKLSKFPKKVSLLINDKIVFDADTLNKIIAENEYVIIDNNKFNRRYNLNNNQITIFKGDTVILKFNSVHVYAILFTFSEGGSIIEHQCYTILYTKEFGIIAELKRFQTDPYPFSERAYISSINYGKNKIDTLFNIENIVDNIFWPHRFDGGAKK